MEFCRLSFNGSTVGCRVVGENETFDIDIDTLMRLNVPWWRLGKTINLRSAGSLLVSTDEEKSGVYSRDISSDDSTLNEIIPALMNLKFESGDIPHFRRNHTITKGRYLDFKMGLVIVLVCVNEESNEYGQVKIEQVVDLIFKTKTALLRVCNVIPEVFDKFRALDKYSRYGQIFRVRLSDSLLYRLKQEFCATLTVLSDGFTHNYYNSYDGMRYSVTLVPPDFDVDYSQWDFTPRVGGVNSSLTLHNYVDALKTSQLQNIYNYYLHLSSSVVKWLWGAGREPVRFEESNGRDYSSVGWHG